MSIQRTRWYNSWCTPSQLLTDYSDRSLLTKRVHSDAFAPQRYFNRPASRRETTSMNPPPNRSPKPGHRWEVCPTCNGKGEIIGRMQSELGGKTTRCPRCFRNGWVEAPIEGKKAASEQATPPAQPRLDWLEGLDAEEHEQESSSTGQKSEREVHGANCNCRSCRSLRKGYARSRHSAKLQGSRWQRYVKPIALPLTFAAIIAVLVALTILLSK